MIRQSEDKKGFFGTIILIVLFFVFVCSIANDTNKLVGSPVRLELASTIHANVVAVNDVQQIVIQKCSISVVEGTKFNLLSQASGIIAFNRMIDQKLIFLQKTVLSIKPITQHWFFNQFHHPDSETPAILG